MFKDFVWNKLFSNAKCQEGSGGYLKRANTEKLNEIFNKYASVEKDGVHYMTSDDFVRRYLGIYPNDGKNNESVYLLAGIVDPRKDGLISFSEFQAFEGLLCLPDALYKTAFQLFDINGNGMVSFDEFCEVIKKTTLHQRVPFDMDGGFIKLYFGKDKKRVINYVEFSQFLHDFHEEYATEAFRRFDKDGTGFISAGDFQDIMVSIKNHLLTPEVEQNLMAKQSLNHFFSKLTMDQIVETLRNNHILLKPEFLFYYGSIAVMATIFIHWLLATFLVMLKPFTCAGILFVFARPDLVQYLMEEERLQRMSDKIRNVFLGILNLLLKLAQYRIKSN